VLSTEIKNAVSFAFIVMA